jgi:hypothetical protein
VSDKGMSDKETAAHLRKWVDEPHGPFEWPTDACGYEQHVLFVNHRHAHWNGGRTDARYLLTTDHEGFAAFVLAYADTLDPAPAPAPCGRTP